jgi:hypothetical protein
MLRNSRILEAMGSNKDSGSSTNPSSLPGKVALELRQEADVVIQKDGGQVEFKGPSCGSDSISSQEYGKRRIQQITTPQESCLLWKHWSSHSGILASMLA